MTVLALDIATTTGWAFGDAGEKPRFGSFTCPTTGDDLGRYGDAFERWFTALVRDFKPKKVVFEAPVLPRAKFDKAKGRIVEQTNLATVRKLNGLLMLTEVALLRAGCNDVEEISSGQWRKLFLGDFYPHNGVRDDFKRAAIAACRQMKWEPNNSDEAEACGIWFVITRVNDPRFAAAEAIRGMEGAR